MAFGTGSNGPAARDDLTFWARPGRFALGQQIGRVGVRPVRSDVLHFLPPGRIRDCLHESDGFGDVLIRSLCRLPLWSQYAIV